MHVDLGEKFFVKAFSFCAWIKIVSFQFYMRVFSMG